MNIFFLISRVVAQALAGAESLRKNGHELAQADMRRHQANLPDRDLAYLEVVGWAQDFACCNRDDESVDRRHASGDAPIFCRRPRSGELSSQLRPEGNAFRSRGVRHPQGSAIGATRRAWHHPRLDGRRQPHRPRAWQPRVILFVQPRH